LSTKRTFQHLSRKQINAAAWDQCLAKANCSLPYPTSWYLDIVAKKNWNALVLGDYEAVFPLPFNRKLFGLTQVQRPQLCQQLWLFGPKAHHIDFSYAIQHIPAAYRRINLSVNGRHVKESPQLQPRLNLVLDLNKDYEGIHAGYNKSLRKRLRRAKERLTIELADHPRSVIQLYRQEIGGRLNWGASEFSLAEHLLLEALNRDAAEVFNVYHQASGTLVGAASFLTYGDRVINILGATNELGKENFAMHLLIDHAIERHLTTSHQLFDFEGSDLPGVANFFRSFGAKEEIYYDYNRDTLPSWVRLAIRLKNRVG